MDDEFNIIVQLLEAFTCPNNEIREESEKQYQNFEQQDPEKAIQILCKIITANLSLNSSLQALIRLRLFLQSSVSSTPAIPLEITNFIKTFLIDYINKSTNPDLLKYSLSIILDFYFKSRSNEEMWNGFYQFLIDLYPREPCLSLSSLTDIYDIYPNENLASCIYSFMKFEKEGELFAQSLVSGLILIKHQFSFEGLEGFLSSLAKMLSCISDDYIRNPLNIFHSVFLKCPDPFSSVLGEIFKFILDTIADSNRNEFIRVQCMYIFSHITLINNEVRSMVLSNPNDVISVIASAISQPNQFIDIYKEAKKGLQRILMSSMDQIKVFDESLKVFGMCDNIYVKSVFLYHINSDQSLNFAFENVFHDDQIIRHNCLKIIIRMINAYDESIGQFRNGEPTLKDRIEEKVVDIFVEYLNRGNFEIYKFFINWCQCGGSKSLFKCTGPVVDLLNRKCYNEKLFMIASYLCKFYPNEAILQEIASNLLQISKKCISEQTEDEFFLEIVKNLFTILDKESKINFLNEIIPDIFNSETLTLSISFMQIIEDLKTDFTPYLQDYLNILFRIANNVDLREVHLSEIPENQRSSVIQDSDMAIVLDSVQLGKLSQMLQSFQSIIQILTEICRSDETTFINIIKIINHYINFIYDDDIQGTAIELCVIFLEKYIKDPEIDVVTLQINSICSAIKKTLEIINISLFSSVIALISRNFRPNYAPYLESAIPLLFSTLNDTIIAVENEGRYIDGDESQSLTETIDNLSSSIRIIFDKDVHLGTQIFYSITKIVPYFKMPNLLAEIQEFISIVWAEFISFAAPEDLPNQQPDLLNDLFEFYHSVNDGQIKENIIIEIGTLVYNRFPELSPSIITEFEKIIISGQNNPEEEDGGNDGDINVKEAAIIQYALLLKKCGNDIFSAKIDGILQMARIFGQYSENIGKYCETLINVAIFATTSNYDDQIVQKVIVVISSLIEQELLEKYCFEDIINECGDFEPLQQFKQSIQKLLDESNLKQDNEGD